MILSCSRNGLLEDIKVLSLNLKIICQYLAVKVGKKWIGWKKFDEKSKNQWTVAGT